MKRRNRAGAPAIEIVDTRMNPNDDPRELALALDGARLARAQGYFLHGGYDGPVIVVTVGDRVIASAPIYSDWGQGFARFALAVVPGREDALPDLISELRAWARHELKSGELIAESPVPSVVPALRAAGYVQRGADWHRPIAANANAAGGKRASFAVLYKPATSFRPALYWSKEPGSYTKRAASAWKTHDRMIAEMFAANHGGMVVELPSRAR